MDYNQMNILKKDFKQTTLCELLVSKWNFEHSDDMYACINKKKNHSTV